MNHDAINDVLNGLLALEQSALSRRLVEATVFVTRLALPEIELVRRMVRESDEHCAWLVALIIDLGGEPAPRGGDLRSADLHFQELHYLLPRVIEEAERVVRGYDRAVEQVAPEPRAARLVARILARRKASLEALRRVPAALAMQSV